MDITPCGFPHSDICGSSRICRSPQLFAACHVLRRLPVPRHSPCALSCLTSPRNLSAPLLPNSLSYNYVSNMFAVSPPLVVSHHSKIVSYPSRNPRLAPEVPPPKLAPRPVSFRFPCCLNIFRNVLTLYSVFKVQAAPLGRALCQASLASAGVKISPFRSGNPCAAFSGYGLPCTAVSYFNCSDARLFAAVKPRSSSRASK